MASRDFQIGHGLNHLEDVFFFVNISPETLVIYFSWTSSSSLKDTGLQNIHSPEISHRYPTYSAIFEAGGVDHVPLGPSFWGYQHLLVFERWFRQLQNGRGISRPINLDILSLFRISAKMRVCARGWSGQSPASTKTKIPLGAPTFNLGRSTPLDLLAGLFI